MFAVLDEYESATTDEINHVISDTLQRVAPRTEIPEEGWSSVILLGLMCAVEEGE